MLIPFSLPMIEKEEIDSASRVIASGKIGGNGEISRRVEKQLAGLLSVRRALLMTSCSHCLECAVRVIGLSSGEEVIIPSFAFPSTANAVLLTGAKVVFADISPSTLNITRQDIEQKLTKKTRGIILIHYAGVSCEMDEIMELARRENLWVIEDAAQAIGSRYKKQPLGSLGDIGCLSFHETKNIVCGEGGVLLTSDDELALRAEIFREKGTNRTQFLEGKIDKYSWVSLGSSFVLSDILASILEVQLGKVERINQARKRICDRYRSDLRELALQEKLSLGQVPDECEPNNHIFFLLVHSMENLSLLQELRQSGVEATSHFYPLHLSRMGKELGYTRGEFPVTEEVYCKLVRLPVFPQMSDYQVDYVIENLHRILK